MIKVQNIESLLRPPAFLELNNFMCTGKRPSSPYNKYDGVVFRTGNNNFKNLLHIFSINDKFSNPQIPLPYVCL